MLDATAMPSHSESEPSVPAGFMKSAGAGLQSPLCGDAAGKRSILEIARDIDPELQARRSAEMRRKNGAVRAFVWNPAVCMVAASFVLTLAIVLYDTQVNDGMIITENNSLCICMSLFVFFPIAAYLALMLRKTSASFLMGAAGAASWIYGIHSGGWFDDLIYPLAVLSVIIGAHVMVCSALVGATRVDFRSDRLFLVRVILTS